MNITKTWDDEFFQHNLDHVNQHTRQPISEDSVLWGIQVNGIHNPTYKVFLEELKKEGLDDTRRSSKS